MSHLLLFTLASADGGTKSPLSGWEGLDHLHPVTGSTSEYLPIFLGSAEPMGQWRKSRTASWDSVVARNPAVVQLWEVKAPNPECDLPWAQLPVALVTR
ncbi:uncharacterized protein LDX57_009331 [Aspergillus melleus]|uniref:uncharacterized protein n=1 Tax=Aspergillus melleus TaxID=138277 RepID=UPI001E8D0DB3|nr:uncharacterized protein LDX57_009331 [Aspergillus melleus]KAH8431677.1 hypothetical protein LDX57_009331 [Aspergillus melleus]